MSMVKLASEIIAGSLMIIPMDGKLQGRDNIMKIHLNPPPSETLYLDYLNWTQLWVLCHKQKDYIL